MSGYMVYNFKYPVILMLSCNDITSTYKVWNSRRVTIKITVTKCPIVEVRSFNLK
jgi:hypothetical protein